MTERRKTKVRSVGMYQAHWQWLRMRADEFNLSIPRVMRMLVELDHRDRILDKAVVNTTHHEQRRQESTEGNGHEPIRVEAV